MNYCKYGHYEEHDRLPECSNEFTSDPNDRDYDADTYGAIDDDGDGDGQPGFCIYGCVDYHLADCPVFDRTVRENEEANW